MKQDSKVRNMLNNEQIKRLREFMMETLDSNDENGRPDLQKIMYNATYNMGEGAMEIGGLILQEKIKLEELEDTLRKTRKQIYEETMHTRLPFNPNAEGVKTMVDGNETISSLTMKVNKQKAYIEFLGNCQEAIRYYPRNANSLVTVANYGREHGMII
ncbi:MAG: hypothetical protein MJZ25_03745 [Fibrobacter sp.]|nr:hypothetical protein [Fibrobacter sp.]